MGVAARLSVALWISSPESLSSVVGLGFLGLLGSGPGAGTSTGHGVMGAANWWSGGWSRGINRADIEAGVRRCVLLGPGEAEDAVGV